MTSPHLYMVDQTTGKVTPLPRRLSVGTLVELKGGGPTLTVTAGRDDEIEAAWFDADMLLHTTRLPIDAIKQSAIPENSDGA